MGEKGFTLLETVIAAGVFLILAMLASNILIYASNNTNSILVRHELMENGRIAMDSIITNVQKAKSVKLEKRPDGMLSQMTLIEYSPSKDGDYPYIYVYHSEYVNKYHRLEFCGNELAKYIRDITIDITDDVMMIEIITDNRTEIAGKYTEAVLLRGSVSVRHKEIGFVE